MQFDYTDLRKKINRSFKKESDFAKALGIGRVSLSQRLNSKLDFKQSEILLSCSLLKIPYKRIGDYFFNQNVQVREHEQFGGSKL